MGCAYLCLLTDTISPNTAHENDAPKTADTEDLAMSHIHIIRPWKVSRPPDKLRTSSGRIYLFYIVKNLADR